MERSPSRRIVFVHAHPDDESLGTGGTIARYSDEGAHVCLVTCTDGEQGEIADVPKLGSSDELKPRLGEIRRQELVEACRILGDVDLRMLGFHDSGMEGTPENRDPRAFVNQDIDEPVRKIVEIIREVRPQVLVTYNAYGFYGHPDHIRAHQATVRAVDAAADRSYASGRGRPHEVAKIYFTAVPKSLLRSGGDFAEQLGMNSDAFFTDDEVERVGTDDDFVTTAIDVRPYIDRKFAALEAHRTQRGTTEVFLSIPSEFRALGFGTEHYVLDRTTVPRPEGVEQDLFEGIED